MKCVSRPADWLLAEVGGQCQCQWLVISQGGVTSGTEAPRWSAGAGARQAPVSTSTGSRATGETNRGKVVGCWWSTLLMSWHAVSTCCLSLLSKRYLLFTLTITLFLKDTRHIHIVHNRFLLVSNMIFCNIQISRYFAPCQRYEC